MEAATQQQEMKKCPACAELILADAVKCKHCGERFGRPGGALIERLRRLQGVKMYLVIGAFAVAVLAALGAASNLGMRLAFYSAVRRARACCESAVRRNYTPPDLDAALALCASSADEAWRTAQDAESGSASGDYAWLFETTFAKREYGRVRSLAQNYVEDRWSSLSRSLSPGHQEEQADRTRARAVVHDIRNCRLMAFGMGMSTCSSGAGDAASAARAIREAPAAATFNKCSDLISAFKRLPALPANAKPSNNQFGSGPFVVAGTVVEAPEKSGDGFIRTTLRDEGTNSLDNEVRVRFIEGSDLTEIGKSVKSGAVVKVKCLGAREAIGTAAVDCIVL